MNVAASQTVASLNIGTLPTRSGVINIGSAGNTGGINILNTNNAVVLTGGTTGYAKVNSTADSTSTADGALRIEGGVGIKKKMYIGDNITLPVNGKKLRMGAGTTFVDLYTEGGGFNSILETSNTALQVYGANGLTLTTEGPLDLGSNGTQDIYVGSTNISGEMFIADNGGRSAKLQIGSATQTGAVDLLTAGALTIDSGTVGAMEIAPSLTTGTANIAKALTSGTVNIGNDAGTGNVAIHGAVTFPDTRNWRRSRRCIGCQGQHYPVDICIGSNDWSVEYWYQK